jgi:phenylacetate-CoA ligase
VWKAKYERHAYNLLIRSNWTIALELYLANKRFEQADSATIRAYQWKKLQNLLPRVREINQFYAQGWRAAGVDLDRIQSLDDFSAMIPMFEKKDYVEDQAQFPPFGKRLEHTILSGDQIEIYTTSGTSGQGVEVHSQTIREMQDMQAMYRYMFRWAGLNSGDHVFFTLPVTMLGGGRIEYQGAMGYGLTTYTVGNDSAQRKLELMRRFRPVAMYGSTSYFGHLAALAYGSDSLESVEVLLTGLEGASIPYLDQLEKSWQAKVHNRFGCTQLKSDFMFTCEYGIGTTLRPGMMHNLDPFVFMEVINPETGEQVKDGDFGELVFTSLYHVDNPVIRCRVRDGGVYRAAAYCPCGRPFGGIEVGSVGRTDDVKKVKGINIFPQTVDDQMYSIPLVDEYEIILTSNVELSDIATARVMAKRALDPDESASLGEVVRQKLRVATGIRFEFELVDNIKRSEYKARRWQDKRNR